MFGLECFGEDFLVVVVDFFVVFVDVLSLRRVLFEEFLGAFDVFEDGDVLAYVAGFSFEEEVEDFDEFAEF